VTIYANVKPPVPTKYRVELLDRKTRRELDRIHEPDFSRITKAILQLEDVPRPTGCRKLRGLEGWRIRVGNWRVIYHIDDDEKLVTVVSVRRRREDTYR
jgi:mRNA interferase RelE/StbE